MAWRRTLSVAILQLFVFGDGQVMADEPTMKVVYKAPEGTLINGRSDPESVPFNIKYQTFFGSFQELFGPIIAQDISQTDYAILNDASVRFQDYQGAEQSTIDAELLDLCSRRASLSPPNVAREVDDIYRRADKERERYFHDSLSRLSSAGKRRITEFVDVQIAGGINTYIPPSSRESQSTDPNEFEYSMDAECHRVATGDYPSELKARMAKFRDEVTRRDQNANKEDR